MPSSRRPALGLILLSWLAAGATASAQVDAGTPPPACTAGRQGMVACLAGRLCACRFDAGGSLTARPPGYRWDCGALRPDCGVVPPTLDGAGGSALLRDLPPLVLQPPAWPGGPEPWSPRR